MEGLRRAAPAWRALAARAVAPNPFAEAEFLLPLLDYEKPPRLRFALVWYGEQLIGVSALQPSRAGGLWRVWRSAYAPLPACLFDRAALMPALAALMKRIGGAGLVFPLTERDGPLARALRALAQAQRLPLEAAGATRRAALVIEGAEAFDRGLDSARAKKWARQARKLATVGPLGRLVGAPAVEAFLSVEASGWKGARRTALADDPARLAFARAVFTAFTEAGRLDALALTLGEKPIAAGVVFVAGGRGFYWKIAYDEAHAAGSPGVQLTLAHTRRLAETPGLLLLDSCAAEDHPMIGRVWKDQIAFDDWALGTGGGAALRFWLGLDRARTRARDWLKRIVLRLLGRKRT
jgi:CelD/BcsL family acetyltransferase involved in cellulose biosynthesis